MINVKKMLLRGGGRSILKVQVGGGEVFLKLKGGGGEVSLKVEFKIPEEDFSNFIAWPLKLENKYCSL